LIASDAPLHQPVLLEALVTSVLGDPCGTYVDATFGRGGHTQALLARLEPAGRVIALDRDPEAAAAAAQIADSRLQFVRRPFSQVSSVLAELALDSVDGILADLGVSSPQLDQAVRGFSFMRDGPLDMRMDPTTGIPLSDWLSSASTSEIAQVLRDYGDERYAGPIARAIVARQQAAETGAEAPLSRTGMLADLIRQTLARAGAPRESQHPATRSFQAFRILINGELEELDALLSQAPMLLKPGGRLGVISFHSLEDRRVKQAFQSARKPAGLARPRGMGRTQFALLSHAAGPPAQTTIWASSSRVRPTEAESARNPRARSAVLRVATRAAR
jgi:16S rRNA (cytosine1402-N4)-methyltransferase